LAQISHLPKIDTVFIDEGYDSLDAETIERLPSLFEMLTNYYMNVITISHLEVVKDMCAHQIRLERNSKYTEYV
jgi:DNA repair exonuclease SbcCD ATPase subunit